MIEHIIEIIEKFDLIKKNQHIVVGFSGGADSLFLVLALLEYQKRQAFYMHCCHINHMLREQEAIRDENFCREFCRKYGIPFYAFRIDVASYSCKEKRSLEEAGRIIRYRCFHKIADKWENSRIAVAHHGDDQVETVLQNMIRGTGLTGLTGMDYKNGKIIRPMLDVYKKDILEYLEREAFSFCVDSTNEENDYNRNRIRNQLIPFLERLNPNVKQAILRMSISLSRDEDYLNQKKQESFHKVLKKDQDGISYIDTGLWGEVHPSIQFRVIMKIIESFHGHCRDISQNDLTRVVELFNKEKGKKELLADLVWEKDSKRVWIYREKKDEFIEKNLVLGKEYSFNGYIIKADKIKRADMKKGDSVYFSKEILTYPLILRNRKTGDRFYPYNAPGEKKLKDFFIDQKIPRFKRNQIPLLVCNHKIIWIPGIRRSNWYLVGEKDEEFIEFTWRKI
ncbi:MAG: tRNA lysidine(34) synthetase TilS [Gallicola sp.]|nr:tRNA lysidine(34) synthetase TilS [Gallicola sp.]